MTKKHKFLDRKVTSLFFIFPFCFLLLWGYFSSGEPGSTWIFDTVYLRALTETSAENLVTAIYLNYRLFDTLLEALLLLVSVIGLRQFSVLASHEKKFENRNTKPAPRGTSSSSIMKDSLTPIYIMITLFGFYVILTGMDGPGGGFQGGAILSAIFISLHFCQGTSVVSIKTATTIEEVAYILILAVGIIFILFGSHFSYYGHRLYLLLCNIFIGIKVCSGLWLIYMTFMYEETEETP